VAAKTHNPQKKRGGVAGGQPDEHQKIGKEDKNRKLRRLREEEIGRPDHKKLDREPRIDKKGKKGHCMEGSH